jgi:AcrR family transcriptional regulator
VAGGAEREDIVAKRVTIHDVAALAGVSRQTVSRAFNDMDDINSETKRRVLEVSVARTTAATSTASTWTCHDQDLRRPARSSCSTWADTC